MATLSDSEIVKRQHEAYFEEKIFQLKIAKQKALDALASIKEHHTTFEREGATSAERENAITLANGCEVSAISVDMGAGEARAKAVAQPRTTGEDAALVSRFDEQAKQLCEDVSRAVEEVKAIGKEMRLAQLRLQRGEQPPTPAGAPPKTAEAAVSPAPGETKAAAPKKAEVAPSKVAVEPKPEIPIPPPPPKPPAPKTSASPPIQLKTRSMPPLPPEPPPAPEERKPVLPPRKKLKTLPMPDWMKPSDGTGTVKAVSTAATPQIAAGWREDLKALQEKRPEAFERYQLLTSAGKEAGRDETAVAVKIRFAEGFEVVGAWQDGVKVAPAKDGGQETVLKKDEFSLPSVVGKSLTEVQHNVANLAVTLKEGLGYEAINVDQLQGWMRSNVVGPDNTQMPAGIAFIAACDAAGLKVRGADEVVAKYREDPRFAGLVQSFKQEMGEVPLKKSETVAAVTPD